ncbi:hypothetical protein ACQUSR_05495 [Streptomyces sp. P1-3]|uniref:hypothetical protein n=1 Tax=Streptomyces sp. P1-3 TaxID=3421658 RepID=UPI003D3645EE
MHLRKNSLRAAAVAGAVAMATGAALAVTGTAHAQDQARAGGPAGDRAGRTAQSLPAFLVPKELPPHPGSDWYASEVTKGLLETAPFCLDKALPSAGSSHRTFWTEYDTGAAQLVVRTGSADAARKLAAAVEKKVRACAADWERQHPQGTAAMGVPPMPLRLWGSDYGTLPAEDGAHVYGVHTSYPDSEPGIHLYGIGLDGRTVTVVKWGQMGDFAHAPVADFKHTTTTAVVKLHG